MNKLHAYADNPTLHTNPYIDTSQLSNVTTPGLKKPFRYDYSSPECAEIPLYVDPLQVHEPLSDLSFQDFVCDNQDLYDSSFNSSFEDIQLYLENQENIKVNTKKCKRCHSAKCTGICKSDSLSARKPLKVRKR